MSRIKGKSNEKGFTLIELLVVAAIIGILLALAIPNLLKARLSANEANAKKMMQVLRDAEGEYFEQDLNNDGSRNYTDAIGLVAATGPNTLRAPIANATPDDQLVDSSFTGADQAAGAPAGDAGGVPVCVAPKSGYCIGHDASMTPNGAGANAAGAAGFDDYGFQATMTSFNKTGRRNFSTYSDGSIRCEVQGLDNAGAGTPPAAGTPGDWSVDRTFPGCD